MTTSTYGTRPPSSNPADECAIDPRCSTASVPRVVRGATRRAEAAGAPVSGVVEAMRNATAAVALWTRPLNPSSVDSNRARINCEGTLFATFYKDSSHTPTSFISWSRVR